MCLYEYKRARANTKQTEYVRFYNKYTCIVKM